MRKLVALPDVREQLRNCFGRPTTLVQCYYLISVSETELHQTVKQRIIIEFLTNNYKKWSSASTTGAFEVRNLKNT